MKTYIGIDPDVEKNGVAVNKGGKIVLAKPMKLGDVVDLFDELKPENPTVVIEAGWMNKRSNWHFAKNEAQRLNIAKKVGRNHQRGKDLIEICEHKGLTVIEQKPLGKKPVEFVSKIAGFSIRNKDVADAVMLVAGRA